VWGIYIINSKKDKKSVKIALIKKKDKKSVKIALIKVLTKIYMEV
jgi:hypothetical protein